MQYDLLYLEFDPWGKDGMTPTYHYCPCCGTEFGVQDWTYEEIKQQRQRWLRAGAQWDEPEEKPDDWDLAEQLHRVLPDRTALIEALKMVEDESYFLFMLPIRPDCEVWETDIIGAGRL